MSFIQRRTLAVSLACSSFLIAGVVAVLQAVAAGGGSMPSSSAPMPERERTPEELARDSYNEGVRLIRKADDAASDAAKATDAAKRQKLQDKSADAYRKSLAKFDAAVQLMPEMYQALNYVGYANRHLGNYAESLAAYDRALALKPDYAEAIEYRGHAYLGLNRLGDAKTAYLALFPANRKLAGQLLSGMQSYVAAQRGAANGTDAAALESFSKWVEERVTIAGQTAALARDGASASWR